MKFVVSLLLIMLLSFIACLYLPWWSIAIMAFIVAATIPQSGLMSFLVGFCGLFILWGGLSLWISSSNDHILAHKTSLLFIKTDSPYLLILLTAIIGALVGGFAAMCGCYFRKVFFSQREVNRLT